MAGRRHPQDRLSTPRAEGRAGPQADLPADARTGPGQRSQAWRPATRHRAGLSGARRSAASDLVLYAALAAALVSSLYLWHLSSPAVRALWVWSSGLPQPSCERTRLIELRDPPMTGDDVAEIQVALAQLGLYEGPADGVFGPETAGAVTVLRMQNDLSASAKVDSAFWTTLEQEWFASTASGRALAAAAAQGSTPPPEGELIIRINIERRQLTLYADGFPYKTYPVAVGKPSTPSAVGQWTIRNKGVNVGPQFGTRWMALTVPWGTYGVHGTNNPGSIGSAASGGCIRMFNHNVNELYEWVGIGTPVHIYSPSWRASVWPSLPKGSAGLSVVFLQWQMQRLSWDPGPADGRLGQATADAVKDLETFYGLAVDGLADTDVLCLLDLDR
ncbi:MAG: hypothetical protein C4551_09150 [Bacillota bacterium]|nr:MAG: hypothetical protein C4551_09150 [Bacillota bacterium]